MSHMIGQQVSAAAAGAGAGAREVRGGQNVTPCFAHCAAPAAPLGSAMRERRAHAMETPPAGIDAPTEDQKRAG